MRVRWAAFFARSLGMEPAEADVVAYGLYVLWLNAASWATLAALAAATGVLGPALWAGLVAATVRVFAGGAHAGSPARCLLISAAVLVGLSLAAQRAVAWPAPAGAATAAALAAGLWWVGTRSPRVAPERPRPAEARRRRWRMMALAVAGAWAVGHGVAAWSGGSGGISPQVLAGAWALAWQGFTLTPAGERLVRGADRALAIAVG